MEYEVPFTIADAADLLSIRKLKDGMVDSFGVECPFCGDMRGKCNFCITKDGEVKNVYHCYSCGASGNMLSLYAELEGIYGSDRYKTAYREIKEKLAAEGNRMRIRRQKRVEQAKRQKKLKEECKIDAGHLDAVYREMLSMLKLKERHKADLRRRGLSDMEISRMEQAGYCSTASEDSRIIARKLISLGFSLKGVPGFYLNGSGDWKAAFYPSSEGYLCPVHAVDGKISGFRSVWISLIKIENIFGLPVAGRTVEPQVKVLQVCPES